MADFIDHPRYATIDTLVQSFIQNISDKQAEYFVLNNNYFQGILTPADPQDGLTDADVNWAIHPTDQADSWKEFDPDVFKPNVQIPFQLRIDVYKSALGFGWILTIEVWIDGYDPDQFGHYGSHWMYRHHEGPDDLSYFILDAWFVSGEN